MVRWWRRQKISAKYPQREIILIRFRKLACVWSTISVDFFGWPPCPSTISLDRVETGTFGTTVVALGEACRKIITIVENIARCRSWRFDVELRYILARDVRGTAARYLIAFRVSRLPIRRADDNDETKVCVAKSTWPSPRVLRFRLLYLFAN